MTGAGQEERDRVGEYVELGRVLMDVLKAVVDEALFGLDDKLDKSVELRGLLVVVNC